MAQQNEGNYGPGQNVHHLNSPFVARDEAHAGQPGPQRHPLPANSQGPRQPEQGVLGKSQDGQQQQRDLDQLREHDRSFQERYKQSMSSPPSQSPAHFFNLPTSENPWAEWQIRRACPSPRFGHSANYIAARDGELFIMGGIRDMDILNDLWVIDTHMLTGYQLRTEGAEVSARVGHAGLTLGNAYILFGGDTKIQETDSLDNNLYLLNTTTLRWTIAEPKGPRPTGRYGHSLVNVGVKLFVFGGQVDDMFYSDMWVFDLTQLRSPTCHWEKVEPLTPPPPPRTNHTVVTYQEKIYLFGGANRDLWYSDTWCYDPALNEWTQLDCTGYVPAPCQGHAATVIGDTMYVFGGMSSQGNLIDQLFALKLTTHKWYTFQNLGPGPCPRSGHSLTAFDGDKILVWGGTDQSSVAYVLDVSRINYPDEATETDTSILNSSGSAATQPDIKEGQRAVADTSLTTSDAIEADTAAARSTQLTRETSARSTPAARNSILLKRQSWQPPQSTVGGVPGQAAAPALSVAESDEFQSATDLPAALNSKGSVSGGLPSEGSVAPLSRPNRSDNTFVPVTTAAALAEAEAAALADSTKSGPSQPDSAAKTPVLNTSALEPEVKSPLPNVISRGLEASPVQNLPEFGNEVTSPVSNVHEVDEVTSPRELEVKESQDIEDITAEIPGALPRSEGHHNLAVASEVGSGTPDTLWRATSSSSEGTEFGLGDKESYDEKQIHNHSLKAGDAESPEQLLAEAAASGGSLSAAPLAEKDLPEEPLAKEPSAEEAIPEEPLAKESFSETTLTEKAVNEAPLEKASAGESLPETPVAEEHGIEAPLPEEVTANALNSGEEAEAQPDSIEQQSDKVAMPDIPELVKATGTPEDVEEIQPVGVAVANASVPGLNANADKKVESTKEVKSAVADAVPARKSIEPSEFDTLRQQMADQRRAQNQTSIGERQNLVMVRRELLDHQEAFGKLQSEHSTLQKQYEALYQSTAEQMAVVSAANEAAALHRGQAEQAAKRADALAVENEELKKRLAALESSQTERDMETKQADYHSKIDDLFSKWSLFPAVAGGGAALAAGGAVAAANGTSREISNGESSDYYRGLYESQRKVIDETQADLNEAYRDISELQEELKQVQLELDTANDRAKSVDDLSAKHKEAESELVTLRAFKEQSSKDSSDLQSQLEAAKARCTELEAEYNKSVEYLQNQQSALSKTRSELARIKEANSSLQDELNDARLLAGPSMESHNDADTSTQSVGSLNYRQAELIIKDLKTQLIIAEEDRDELREQVHKMKKAALADRV